MMHAPQEDASWRDVPQRLARLLLAAPNEAAHPEPFDAAPAPACATAVDGSSAVAADAGGFLVGVTRVATVRVDAGRPRPPHVGAPHLRLLEKGHVRQSIEAALAAVGVTSSSALRAELRPSEGIHLLRQLDESLACVAAIEELPPGGLLLVDGALRAEPFPEVMGRLAQRAQVRKVDVVGVCKSTSLRLGGAPALAACSLAAREKRLVRWMAEVAPPPAILGRVLLARLSPAEPRAFRLDVRAHDGDAPRVVRSLSGLAGHPAYPGYPSPLAMAHNAATIGEDERLRLRGRLAEAAEAAGVDAEAWRLAFEDYHDVLELGV